MRASNETVIRLKLLFVCSSVKFSLANAKRGGQARSSMLTAVKCAAFAVVAAVAGMAVVAACLSSGDESAVATALFCLETICYALVDMTIGQVVERRRVSHWAFIIAALSMVTALGPIGVAVSKVLRIVCVDSIMSRDPFTRRRTAVAVLTIVMHCLVACIVLVDHYGLGRVGLVLRSIQAVWLIILAYWFVKHVTRDDVVLSKTDVAMVVSGIYAHSQKWFIMISSLPVHPLASSVLLMFLIRVLIRGVMPLGGKWLGDDWRLAMPAVVLMSELGAILLLLQTAVNTWSFWLVVILQEANAAFKNLGVYDWVVVTVRATVGHPVGDDAVLCMEVRRRIVSPCDCIAEMISPVFVLFHIALGNVFRSIPVNIGVVVSMCVALAIRTMFSLTEFAFEYYRSETTTPLCEMSMWFEASALPGHHNCAIILLCVVQPALLVVLTAM